MIDHFAKQGTLFILSAPAGTGKTTLVNRLIEKNPQVVRNVTCTTRPIRESEVDGRDYFFLNEAMFLEKVENGEFLEYAEVYGYYYGTLFSSVEKELKLGRDVILVIDTQGAKTLRKIGKLNDKSPVFIFLAPPSLEELAKRLKKRGTESEKSLQLRLEAAERELREKDYYDYVIVNDDLEKSFYVLSSIITAEKYRNPVIAC